jgi:hypothetical protein
MRRNGYDSAAILTRNERALLQQVTALQFENSAISLELKSIKVQQEAFLEEVEIEIEAQKSECLAAATNEINQLQLQLRQAAEALKRQEEIEAQKSERLAAATNEINQLQLQLRQATETLNSQEVFVSKASLQMAHKSPQTGDEVLGVSSSSDTLFLELETRLAASIEANIKVTQLNIQLSKDLEEARSATHEMALSASRSASSAHPSQAYVESVAVQTSASDTERWIERSSQDRADLLSRIRIENFRNVILRNFCIRIASAPMCRIFRLWKRVVKEHVYETMQQTLEAKLHELTEIHQITLFQMGEFQASDHHAISLLWNCLEKIGNSRFFANSRKTIRLMWRHWLRMIRIRRRVQTCLCCIMTRSFMLWRRCIKHHRMIYSFLQHKKNFLFQKAFSFWKHETLVNHIVKQQFQVQQAAEKFVKMHEAQNEAVSAIKQTCSEMMADLESSTSERHRVLSLFLSCEGKLLALFCFYKSNLRCRCLFQIWKRKIGNRKKLNHLEMRLLRNFAKRTLLLWYFDSKTRILNDFHEQQISESIESLELERQTTAAALHNTEEELAETLTNLDDALLEIHQLVHINNQLSIETQKKPSQDCEIQTDKAVLCDAMSATEPLVETQDNETQTQGVLLDDSSPVTIPNVHTP